MATLRVRYVQFKEVWWHALQSYVKDLYGHALPDDSLCYRPKAGDCVIVQVARRDLAGWEADRLQHFANTGKGFGLLKSVLIDLCNRNFLKPGEYHIVVGGEE